MNDNTVKLSNIEIDAMRKHYADGKFFGIALEDGRTLCGKTQRQLVRRGILRKGFSIALSKSDRWSVYYLSDKGKELFLSALSTTAVTGVTTQEDSNER